MTIGVIVPGPAQLFIATGSPANLGALTALGYSINGVEIAEETFMGDVPGDQNGGDQGPPIEIQHFGEIHRVRAEMSNWDYANAELVSARLSGLGAGNSVSSTYPAGTLIKSNNLGFRLVILPTDTTKARNYLYAIPRQAIQRNVGSRFSRYVVEFECHDVSGVLWNGTLT